MTTPSEPPQFPFRRTGRVVHSARGLYGLAGCIAVLVVLFGMLPLFSAGGNSTTNLVILYVFLAILLAMSGSCVYWGRRVQAWEREYERATGRGFRG